MPEAGAFMAGAIVSKLLMDKSGWDQSIRSVKKDEESLTGAAGRIGRGFQKTGAIMAVAGAAIAGSIVLMIKKTAAQGDAFYDLSQKTGISAKMLSSYKLAADTTGASIEDLGVGLRIMAKNAVHAATEGGNFKEKFDRMGISVTDVHGRVRPMNDLLLDLADRFSKMPDGTIKTAMAMEIFGRSGTNLIPMLNLGRKGLQENAEMAQRLGLVYTDKAAKASDDFMDRTTELKESFRGLTKEIAIGAMPVMTKYIAMIRDGVASITAWVQKHGGLTSSLLTITAAAGAFTAVLGTGIMILGSLIVKLGILAVALKTTVGALAVSTALFAAGAAAVAIYAVKLWELQKAKDKLREADYALFEAEQNIGKKLREAADAAGMTRREFVQLTEEYHGNIRALAWAIMKGKEGKEIQEALAKVGKKHAETVEEQKKKMEAARLAAAGLGSEFMNLGKKTETLAEKLNLLTFEKIRKQIADNAKALKEYAGQLPVAEVARLKKENEELEDSLQPIPGLLKLFGETAQQTADGGLMSLSAMLRTTDTDAENWNRSWQRMNDDLEASFKEIAEKNKKAQKEQTKTTEAETERQAHLFDGLYNDIAMGLSDTIEKIIDGTEKFGSFFKGFLTTIKKSFARVLAEMVSDYVVKFIKLIIEKTGLLKALSGIFDSIFGGIFGKAVGGAAAGAAGAGAAGAAGTVGTAGAGAAGATAGAAAGAAIASAFLIAWGAGMIAAFGALFKKYNLRASFEPIFQTYQRDQEEWLWSIYGGTKNKWTPETGATTEPTTEPTPISSPSRSGSFLDRLRAKAGKASTGAITVEVNFNGTMITDREFVRSRLIREIHEAFESHAFRTKMQRSLGIG